MGRFSLHSYYQQTVIKKPVTTIQDNLRAFKKVIVQFEGQFPRIHLHINRSKKGIPQKWAYSHAVNKEQHILQHSIYTVLIDIQRDFFVKGTYLGVKHSAHNDWTRIWKSLSLIQILTKPHTQYFGEKLWDWSPNHGAKEGLVQPRSVHWRVHVGRWCFSLLNFFCYLFIYLIGVFYKPYRCIKYWNL